MIVGVPKEIKVEEHRVGLTPESVQQLAALCHRFLVQAGAGIVADSNPTAEYEETRDKARALLRALELAQRGLSELRGKKFMKIVSLAPEVL